MRSTYGKITYAYAYVRSQNWMAACCASMKHQMTMSSAGWRWQRRRHSRKWNRKKIAYIVHTVAPCLRQIPIHSTFGPSHDSCSSSQGHAHGDRLDRRRLYTRFFCICLDFYPVLIVLRSARYCCGKSSVCLSVLSWLWGIVITCAGILRK